MNIANAFLSLDRVDSHLYFAEQQTDKTPDFVESIRGFN